MNILVVENDVAIGSILMELIERWGHNVENATSGKEALKRFTEDIFDLILLDIFLPDGKGHLLIPQFKKLCPKIGIITMTSYNSRELEREVREQGILYYMIKPFDIRFLKEILDHISHKYDQKRNSKINLQVREEVIVSRKQTMK